MRVISAGKFNYNGRAVRPHDEVDMTEQDYAEFRKFGMVRLPNKDELPVKAQRDTYRRRDMRSDP